tara:strand:- start:191 stop:310 length:120 start_codon:yes stop_codon:yes gene_type:complete
MRFHELKEAYFNKNPTTKKGKRDPNSKEHVSENVVVKIG